MRLTVICLLLSGVLVFAQVKTTQASVAGAPQALRNSRRLLVVTTPSWNSVDGTMQRYELRSGKWEKVGASFPIVVGKSGLGWDPTFANAQKNADAPTKHEGDGRSPAGVFEIGNVFGFADNGPTGRKYIPLTPATECVDDVKSDHYAHIVDRNAVPSMNWNSSEKMREIEVYKLGMVVNYNLANTVPGNGSCIFLHIWKGPGRGTAGCTAMEEAQLLELVKWLGDEKAALVQMPASDYKRLKTQLRLP